MRILLITHIYPPAVDGGSKVITNLGQYFQSLGHQILVLTTNCRSTDDFVNPASQPVIHHQTNVLALPVYKHFRRSLKFINFFFHSDLLSILQKGPLFRLFPFFRSLNAIRQFRPDLIIAGPLPTTVILYASLITKITHTRILINASFHPTDPDFIRQPLINALKKADFIWTLTNYETNYLHLHFAIPKSKMINVGNGVDKSFLLKHPHTRLINSFNLLFIGSFASHKGITTLIDSLNYLPPKVTLTIAGQKTLYFPILEQKLKNLSPNIRSRIKIVTSFTENSKSRLIDSCTILISPSTQESFGLVLLEAWARFKPVIVADIPASFELINKTRGGLTFNHNDPYDLSFKIKLLLKNPLLRRQMAQNGYKYVQTRATWDRIGQVIWSKISSSSF